MLPPTWRPDLTLPADLVEEVARLEGYDDVPSVVPRAPGGRGLTEPQRLRRRAADALAAAGYVETPTFPFLGEDAFDALGLAEDDDRRHVLRLANPLSAEQAALRTTMLPGLLAALARNVGRGSADLALFDVGAVVLPGLPTACPTRRCPASTAGPPPSSWPRWTPRCRASPATSPSCSRGRGSAPRGTAPAARRRGPTPPPPPGWSPTSSAPTSSSSPTASGCRGTPAAARRCGWRTPTGRAGAGRSAGRGSCTRGWCARSTCPPGPARSSWTSTRWWPPAGRCRRPTRRARSRPRSSTWRSSSPTTCPTQPSRHVLRDAAGSVLESLRLFDRYRDERLGDGVRSLTYRVVLRAPDRTLTDAETGEVRAALV